MFDLSLPKKPFSPFSKYNNMLYDKQFRFRKNSKVLQIAFSIYFYER